MRSLIATALAIFLFCANASSQSPANRRSVYEQWLWEDVAYIITDQEAAQYRSLMTNAGRDQFIREFWLRRDPTPGTVENEYKEEHYRRLAYSNQHFAESVPGWKTDRGRTYIVEGPPDHVIQLRLTTGEQAQDWIWDASPQTKRGSRRMTFVDTCTCGRYVISTSNVTDN